MSIASLCFFSEGTCHVVKSRLDGLFLNDVHCTYSEIGRPRYLRNHCTRQREKRKMCQKISVGLHCKVLACLSKSMGQLTWHGQSRNVFVQIQKCICQNPKMYLSKLVNVFVPILKCICLSKSTRQQLTWHGQSRNAGAAPFILFVQTARLLQTISNWFKVIQSISKAIVLQRPQEKRPRFRQFPDHARRHKIYIRYICTLHKISFSSNKANPMTN